MVIIFLWGVQPERSLAFLSLLLYSLISVLPLLFFLGVFSFVGLSFLFQFPSFISFLVVFGFLIKVPLYLFHYWLPKAHVEAPTAGSILLAGLLLKLGGWGLFSLVKQLGSVFVLGVCVLGALFGAILAMFQRDVKRLIAFSSVCHMNFITWAFYLKVLELKVLGVVIIVAHAVISSLMF